MGSAWRTEAPQVLFKWVTIKANGFLKDSRFLYIKKKSRAKPLSLKYFKRFKDSSRLPWDYSLLTREGFENLKGNSKDLLLYSLGGCILKRHLEISSNRNYVSQNIRSVVMNFRWDMQLNISHIFSLKCYLFPFDGLKQSEVYFDSRVATQVRMISLFAFLLFIWWVPLLDIAMTFQ